MNQRLVITLIGQDQPGLVNQFSQVLAEHQANWLESRFSHLDGQFSGMVSTQLAPENAAALSQALDQFAQTHSMSVLCQQAQGTKPTENQQDLALEVVGTDRLGIIQDVTQVLVRHQANINTVDTETHDAPMSSEPLFTALIEVSAPESLSIDQLLEDLEAIDDSLEFELFKAMDEQQDANNHDHSHDHAH